MNITASNVNIFPVHGINKLNSVYHNLSYDEIFKHESAKNEGTLVNTKYGEVVSVDTGKFTGRSPKDRFIVYHEGSESAANIDWGAVNQKVSPQVFEELRELCVAHYNRLDKAYVFDGFCGSSLASRKKVRFLTEFAWQHHFVSNMFIKAKVSAEVNELLNFEPDFTIINACMVTDDKWKQHGLNSEVFVLFDIEQKLALIGGTFYGGEMKKGIFSMMNYWLPLNGVMSMHCSANIGKDGDTVLFFGLSGTGKTTLSADPDRNLIGDDEHGWDDHCIFNFEGGCYAKTINLKEENEPEIYRAIKRDALLENVMLVPNNDGSVSPNYDDSSKTENGRVSYPMNHIANHVESSMGGHPRNIIFLACDAFGVLPPVSVLTPQQAMYHFLSGYTAKVAGTERGITKPVVTFAACFGDAFMTLHPTVYADLLEKKMVKYNCRAYLVNTGWSGGGPGVGKRMAIRTTRACVNAILNGSIHGDSVTYAADPVFQFQVPNALPGVPEGVLNPREAWANKEEYDNQRIMLAKLFEKNFAQFVVPGKPDYSPYGPVVSN